MNRSALVPRGAGLALARLRPAGVGPARDPPRRFVMPLSHVRSDSCRRGQRLHGSRCRLWPKARAGRAECSSAAFCFELETQLSALCVTCPHEQCQVDLVTDQERLARMVGQDATHPLFECGCHFSVFDAADEGARLSGESPRGLYRFRDRRRSRRHGGNTRDRRGGALRGIDMSSKIMNVVWFHIEILEARIMVSSTPQPAYRGGSMTKMLTRVALLAVLCMLGGNTVLAQLQSGRIVGTIFDTQRAGIPGATVTVTNVATNLSRTCRNRFAGQLRRHAARSRHLQRERRDARLPDDRQERARR